MLGKDIYQKLLPEFISFKSISTDSSHREDMTACANWLKDTFEAHHFTVDIVKGYGNPVVIARHEAGQQETALIYGHYDVQPAVRDEGWMHDPFEVHERDGRIYGRGVVDNKGQVLVHMATIFALIKEKKLGYNVVFMIEGDEETGGGNLKGLMLDHPELLTADFALTSDGTLIQDTPLLETGFRGGFNTTVTIRTSHTDLHSGMYGGATPNAGLVMNKFIAQLHDENNRVTIPEFYDDVDPISDETTKQHKGYPFNHDEHCKVAGIKGMDCEPEYDFYLQTGLRPAVEITGMEFGYTGEGYRNAIPSWARAKINFRLVESQKGDKIAKDFEMYSKSLMPDFAEIEVNSTDVHRGIKLDVNNPYIQKAHSIIKDVYGVEPMYLYCGGGIPVITDFREVLGLPQALVPIANEDSNVHAANENYEVKQLERSLQFSEKFFTL